MRREHEVASGLTSTDEVLELLDAAYGDWGSEALFEWKAAYPGTDRDEQFLYIRPESRLSAFTRLYHRPITVDGTDVDAVVRGNSAVHPEYQRQGQYKALHDATAAHCDARDVDIIMSFNQKENPSFRTSSKSAWGYAELPLQMSILSPEAALTEYATPVLESEPALERLVALFGPRVRLSVGGDVVSLASLLGESVPDRRGLTVYLSRAALHDLIELAANGADPSALVRRSLSLVARNEISLREPPKSPAPEPDLDGVDFVPRGLHTADDLERFCDLHEPLDRDGSDVVRFRRRVRDVEHMLEHPHLLGTFRVNRDGDAAGFAPLYAVESESVLEARVADLAAVDRGARDDLLEAIRAFCRTIGADVLVTFVNDPPGEQWVRIRRHVLMWNERTGNVPDLREKRWRLGFYDVV